MPLFGPPNIEKLKTKSNVKGLVKALRYRKDPSVSQLAAQALDEIGWHPDETEAGAYYWIAKQEWVKCAEIGVPAVKPILSSIGLLPADSYEEIASALAQIGLPAVKPLIKGYNGESVEVRADVSDIVSAALVQIGVPGIELMLSSAAHGDERVREAVTAAVARLGSPAVEPLIEALQDKNEKVRKMAVTALGEIGDPSAVKPLVALMTCAHPRFVGGNQVARCAAETLVLFGVSTVEPLCTILMDRNNRVVGYSALAARTLAEIGDARAVGPIIDVLKVVEQDLTGWTTLNRRAVNPFRSALVEFGEAAVEPLIAVLREEEPVIAEAIITLVEIGEPAVQPLIASLKTMNAPVGGIAMMQQDEKRMAYGLAAARTEEWYLDFRYEEANPAGSIAVRKDNPWRVLYNVVSELASSINPLMLTLVAILRDRAESNDDAITQALEAVGWLPDEIDQ